MSQFNPQNLPSEIYQLRAKMMANMVNLKRRRGQVVFQQVLTEFGVENVSNILAKDYQAVIDRCAEFPALTT